MQVWLSTLDRCTFELSRLQASCLSLRMEQMVAPTQAVISGELYVTSLLFVPRCRNDQHGMKGIGLPITAGGGGTCTLLTRAQ